MSARPEDVPRIATIRMPRRAGRPRRPGHPIKCGTLADVATPRVRPHLAFPASTGGAAVRGHGQGAVTANIERNARLEGSGTTGRAPKGRAEPGAASPALPDNRRGAA